MAYKARENEIADKLDLKKDKMHVESHNEVKWKANKRVCGRRYTDNSYSRLLRGILFPAIKKSKSAKLFNRNHLFISVLSE